MKGKDMIVMYENIKNILALIVLVGLAPTATGNPLVLNNGLVTEDSVTVQKLLNKADEALKSSQFEKAKIVSSESLIISKRLSYLRGEAMSNYIKGVASEATGQYSESVKNYLMALKAFGILNDHTKTVNTNAAIGRVYQTQNAHQQAIRYFEKAIAHARKSKGKMKQGTALLENIAFSYTEIKNYSKSIEVYEKILTQCKTNGNTNKLIETYQKLSALSLKGKRYRRAQMYNSQLANIYSRTDNLAGLSTVYNNMGFIYKRTNDLKTSSEYFSKVASLISRQPKGLSNEDKAILYINTGVAYSNLKTYSKAKENYLKALRVREKAGEEVLIADAKNYLAGGYYVSGNMALALKTVNSAVVLAKKNNAENILATSYKILYLINDKEDNTSQAKKYLEKHKALEKKMLDAQKDKQKELLKKQMEVEKGEESIRKLIEEEDRLAVESVRKESELKIKEKELAILKKDQALREAAYKNQVLEQERTKQALAFAHQQLAVEKNERELASLEKEKEFQKLELSRKALEEEKQKKAIALLEADKKLKGEQLEKEEAARKYGYGIIGLLVLIMGVVAFGFNQKRKANKQLEQQQHEIFEKNEELQKSMVALQDTQNALQEQKTQLEIQNDKVTNSIQYAQRIQHSILPTSSVVDSLFPESFIMYLPKDIVSGDFYWVAEIDGKKVLAIVDCTGHGVPGSLMSMVGSNILNELVNQRRITDPGKILNGLHLNLYHH